MTSSLNTDAINTAIVHGAQAVMVTEYMPGGKGAQVINTATTGTIYLGTTSSVQPSTGVPVPAGSSVQWVREGQMWAVAGPDVVSTITLVTTSCVSNWSPSPEVVATAVAAELLATGIPNVLTETVIGTYVLPPIGESSAVNVSGYASVLLIMIDAPANNPNAVNIYFTDNTFTAVASSDEWTSEFAAPNPIVVPVLGPIMMLGMGAADANSSHTIKVTGSNRPAPYPHPTIIPYSAVGVSLATGTTALIAGTTYPLATVVAGRQFGGPARCGFGIGSATVKGLFILQCQTSEGVINHNLTDTSDPAWHTAPGTTTQVANIAPIGLFQNRWVLNFLCSTGGTANVFMTAVPLS